MAFFCRNRLGPPPSVIKAFQVTLTAVCAFGLKGLPHSLNRPYKPHTHPHTHPHIHPTSSCMAPPDNALGSCLQMGLPHLKQPSWNQVPLPPPSYRPSTPHSKGRAGPLPTALSAKPSEGRGVVRVEPPAEIQVDGRPVWVGDRPLPAKRGENQMLFLGSCLLSFSFFLSSAKFVLGPPSPT